MGNPNDPLAYRWRTHNPGRVLSNALRRFEERVMALMSEAGHSQTRLSHVNLTRHLDLEGTRITELARRASITNPAMTELIDQCETLGLVERVPDSMDKRVRVVRFTPAGLAWLTAFGRAVAEAEAEMANDIGARGMKSLLTDLASYAASMEPSIN
jgi:DNA-binding MarR family transcriptional regulator